MRILERWVYLLLIIPMLSFNVLVAQQPLSTSQNSSKVVQQPGNSASSMGTANVNSLDAGSGVLLGPGDLVDIGVYNVPELATKARIGSNGDIYLPLVDYIHIAGLTPEEAQNLIQKKLADGGFVRNPHVNVFVDEHAMKGASLLGEVAKPGIYPMLGQQRLFDLISAAGGFTSSAGRSISITHRDQPDKPVVVPCVPKPVRRSRKQYSGLSGRHHNRQEGGRSIRRRGCRAPQRVSHGQWTPDRASGDRTGRWD